MQLYLIGAFSKPTATQEKEGNNGALILPYTTFLAVSRDDALAQAARALPKDAPATARIFWSVLTAS